MGLTRAWTRVQLPMANIACHNWMFLSTPFMVVLSNLYTFRSVARQKARGSWYTPRWPRYILATLLLLSTSTPIPVIT